MYIFLMGRIKKREKKHFWWCFFEFTQKLFDSKAWKFIKISKETNVVLAIVSRKHTVSTPQGPRVAQ